MRARAYPRGRGGAYETDQYTTSVAGLSPRTRGSHDHREGDRLRAGPIPADAGEPYTFLATEPVWMAYPRGRGGALAQAGKDIWVEGLSPRTRGSLGLSPRPDQDRGPIPADAGEP